MRPNEPERQFDDPDDELLESLRTALRPGPLPPALVTRVRADWERRSTVIRRLRVPPMHLVGLVAAACLMVALLLPPRPAVQTAERTALVALSTDEAAAIVTAFGILTWDGPVDYSLDVVDASLDNIERTLRREADSETMLPWDSNDDWDVPLTIDENSSHGEAPSRGSVLRRV